MSIKTKWQQIDGSIKVEASSKYQISKFINNIKLVKYGSFKFKSF